MHLSLPLLEGLELPFLISLPARGSVEWMQKCKLHSFFLCLHGSYLQHVGSFVPHTDSLVGEYRLNSRGAQVYLLWVTWDLRFLTRDQTHVPLNCRWVHNHWTTKEPPPTNCILKRRKVSEQEKVGPALLWKTSCRTELWAETCGRYIIC